MDTFNRPKITDAMRMKYGSMNAYVKARPSCEADVSVAARIIKDALKEINKARM